MLKCELEKKLNKNLTDTEYCKYMHDEFLKKKNIVKKSVAKKENILSFNDAKNNFLNLLESESEKKYYSKEFEYILKFDNSFLLFSKPDIKTRFCFGYGLNGVSTQEDYNNAREAEKYASESEKYFINENSKEINQNILNYEYLLLDNNKQYKL